MTERTKPETTEPIPEQYQKGQWRPVAYTMREGGDWIYAESNVPKGYSSLRYANGWIFDTILKAEGLNPWRHIDGEDVLIDDGTTGIPLLSKMD
jgi:hypothetical protein